ncbi:MAG: hypothetical protein ACR2HY_04725 [Acidimicrobiales bacterium]
MAVLADEGPSVDYSQIPPAVYVIGAVVVAVLILAAIVAALVLYRRARRSGAWRRASLVVQAEALSGPRRDLAQLRLDLDESLATAQAVVAAAGEGGSTVGDLDLWVGQLQAAGGRLAAQLDRLSGGTMSETALARILPPLRARVDDVGRVAGQLADATAAAVGGAAGVELEAITAGVADELGVLDARVAALRELANREGVPTTPHAASGP